MAVRGMRHPFRAGPSYTMAEVSERRGEREAGREFGLSSRALPRTLWLQLIPHRAHRPLFVGDPVTILNITEKLKKQKHGFLPKSGLFQG